MGKNPRSEGFKAYRAGADFERAVRAALTSDGYEVIRSAGSKTKVDLVAFKTGELLFVQCKKNGRISPAERESLLMLAALVAATPIVAAHTGPRGARIAYFRLTGPGPRDRAPWTADHAFGLFDV